MKTVLIAGGGTGGHLMPALAIADAIVRLEPDLEPVLVGARRGVETRLLPERPYRYHLLSTEPIYRTQWWRNLRWPALAVRVLRQARGVIRAERPVVAIGTGGYAAGPPLVAAHRAGVPIVLQEQNAHPGVVTRRLASKAAQVHLGFPEAEARLRVGGHTEVHHWGNPVAPPPDPRPSRAEARGALGLPADRPTLLVMGGSQGARRINEVVGAAVGAGHLDGVSLLWSTGPGTYDDYARLDAAGRRVVRAFWDPIAEAYAAADLVVARAGAMTTAELCAWGLPAVLIPLPHAAGGHQDANAAALEAAGAVVRVPEADLSVDTLADRLRYLFGTEDRLAAMGSAAEARGNPKAAENIARTVLNLVR